MKSQQKSLVAWTKQKWRTNSGKPSLETGERYLPDAAWKSLKPGEKAATNRAKKKGMKSGKQFVPQPEKVAEKTAGKRKTYLDRLRDIDVRLVEFSPDLYRVEPTVLPPQRKYDASLKRLVGAQWYKTFKSERGRLFADNLEMLNDYGHGAPDHTTYKVSVSDQVAKRAARPHHSGKGVEYLLPRKIAKTKVRI